MRLFNNIPRYLNQGENPIFYFWKCKSSYSAYAATLPNSYELFNKKISVFNPKLPKKALNISCVLINLTQWE